MTRAAYSLLMTLALPLICLRLLWRGLRQRGYLRHVGERFGRFSSPPSTGCIWIHAVSVGETRAAKPLIDALRARFSDRTILLTGMTPAGRQTAIDLFGDTVTIAFLPYDLAWLQRRLITHFRPALLLVMETEIWPNLLHACTASKVPAMLINARLSERSRRGYARFAPVRSLVRDALQSLHAVSAQSAADAERLASLGARNVVVNGNLKFDFLDDPIRAAIGKDWRTSAGKSRVLVLASTRDGEESQLLQAYARAFDAEQRAGTLLVVVPRHPQRFDAVWALLEKSGLRAARRSAAGPAGADVWLGDSMGEMSAYFSMADVAIVGGSFENLGGQNFIEAAALGVPVVVGPHTFNFAEATRMAAAAGALLQVEDSDGAMQLARELFQDDAKRTAMGVAAKRFAEAHQGATEKTMGLIATLLVK
ncbi:MAG: lipid IV(A) 3-deoxy-D-manno-octulosonic acid transferase [Betaproteobacteria bacterium]|nr:lipid IV(A) 3-deoxy-D-manno-octulosonic acid transferase [Betaproteobacteria bacterium]